MENYGSFKDLAGDKKGMSAEEAYIMMKNLGLLGQEFVPGATSLRKLMEGDFKGAGSELNDWIPGGKAIENFVDDKPQDWEKNALDAIIFGKPLVKGVKKAASAIEKMPKGGKEGFIRNPQFDWKSLTPPQKVATDKAIKDWNYGVKHNKELYDPRPENIPIDVEYEQPRMNKINKYFSNQYKFTPKTFNDIGLMEENPNVITQAILPENVNDAAYLRHNPVISNYDAVLKANRTQIGNDANKGLLKSGMPYSRTAADPRYDDQYVIQYRTNTGDYADQSNKAKRDMLLQLEKLFPGYIKAMEGR